MNLAPPKVISIANLPACSLTPRHRCPLPDGLVRSAITLLSTSLERSERRTIVSLRSAMGTNPEWPSIAEELTSVTTRHAGSIRNAEFSTTIAPASLAPARSAAANHGCRPAQITSQNPFRRESRLESLPKLSCAPADLCVAMLSPRRPEVSLGEDAPHPRRGSGCATTALLVWR